MNDDTVVIKIGSGYFCGFTKTGGVIRSFQLKEAKFFDGGNKRKWIKARRKLQELQIEHDTYVVQTVGTYVPF